MAEGVERMPGTEERRELEPLASRVQRDRGGVYGKRFMIAYLLMVVVFGGLVALVTYSIARPDGEPWGGFEPKGEGLARATSIAEHVTPQYVEAGQQMAIVSAQPPVVENIPVDAVAVARDTTRGIGGGYISVDPSESTLIYVFCGLEEGCTLPFAPSPEHEKLLRRASLQIALYTFKYMDDVDSVVTMLPPRSNQTRAVYLRRGTVDSLLDKPMSATLRGKAPFTVTNMVDGETVERWTAKRSYPSRFQQLPNGRAILVLGGPQPQQGQQQQTGSANTGSP